MKFRTRSYGILAFLALAGCRALSEPSHEQLNGILWMQTSAEYRVASIQTFRAAEHSAQEALENRNWTAVFEQTNDYQSLPPAVITDVDETVLDNTPFQAQLVLENAAFDAKKWTAWVRECRAEAVPGAKEFIAFLKSKNIRVFYVTNRTQKEPTLLNLRRVLDPEVTEEQVLCKNEQPGWGSDKTSRRTFLAQKYRILLLLGDDYNDFSFLGNGSPEERTARAESQTAFWGKKWFLISNPLYGSWERALYDFDYGLSTDQQLNKKIRHLKASY